MPKRIETRIEVWPRWMSYDIAGQYMCMSAASIRKLVDSGKLPFSKINSMRLIDRNKIDQFMERLETRIRS